MRSGDLDVCWNLPATDLASGIELLAGNTGLWRTSLLQRPLAKVAGPPAKYGKQENVSPAVLHYDRQPPERRPG